MFPASRGFFHPGSPLFVHADRYAAVAAGLRRAQEFLSEAPADYANAVKYLSEAIRHKHDKWVPRTLYIALQKNGQYQEAKAGWERYLAEVDPNNANAPRFIKTKDFGRG